MKYLNLALPVLFMFALQSAQANVANCLQMKTPVKVLEPNGKERSIFTKKFLIDEDLPNESANQKVCYFGFYLDPKVYYCATDEGRVGDDNLAPGASRIHICKSNNSLWSIRPELVGTPHERYEIKKVEFTRSSDTKLHFHLFNRFYRDALGTNDITSHIITNGYYDFMMDEI